MKKVIRIVGLANVGEVETGFEEREIGLRIKPFLLSFQLLANVTQSC